MVYAGAETSAEESARCKVLPYECVEDRISVVDAARDGDALYVLANTSQWIPMLFVSEDQGVTWTSHQLPPSFEVVEGVEDNTPGLYLLHPWQGRLHMLVEAITVGMGYHFWDVTEVNLATNTYTQRSEPLLAAAAPVYFDGATALQASTEGDAAGDVYWNRYDFETGTISARGEAPLAATGLYPRMWASVDGRTLTALSERAGAGGSTQVCTVAMNGNATTPTLDGACLSRLKARLGAVQNARPVRVRGGLGWLTTLGGHSFVTTMAAATTGSGAAKAEAIDLGPGEPLPQNFRTPMRPRFGDFLAIAEPAQAATGNARLLHIPAAGPVQEVGLPLTPCEQASGPCGYGNLGMGFGSAQWAIPVDGGDVLVFHVVNQVGGGNRQLLVMTREHPTFKPAAFAPLVLGVLPGLPAVKPARPVDEQCMRAVVCGYHRDLISCQQYWQQVRHGAGGGDTAFAAFLAAPAGTCAALEAAYTDRRDPAREATKRCAPGCEDGWATYGCAPWGSTFVPPRDDCAARGMPCRIDAMGRGYCANRDLAPADCDTCEGSLAISCLDIPLPTMTDCAARGAVCHVEAADGTRKAHCAPAMCTSAARSQCEGNVQAYCSSSGDKAVIGEYDCGRFSDDDRRCAEGGPCQVYGTGCQSTGCESELLLYCDGDDATRVIDCLALGYSGCETKVNGTVPEGVCVR